MPPWRDCSPPGSSVHVISQARILEQVAISSSGYSFQPRDWTCVSCSGRQILYHWATREVDWILYQVSTKCWDFINIFLQPFLEEEKKKKKRILATGSSCRREIGSDTGCQGSRGTQVSSLWCWPRSQAPPGHACSSLVAPNVRNKEHCLTLKSPHHEDHSQDCAPWTTLF